MQGAHYFLKKNLKATGTHCIVIHDSNVTIDMKGHTIEGDKTVGHDGITDDCFFLTGVAIANGKIKDFDAGIDFCDSHVITITHVDSSDNKEDGIFINGSDNAFFDVKTNRNGDQGIDLDSNDNLITNVQANNNTDDGIEADDHNGLSNVQTNHNGHNGLDLGFDNVIAKSTASNNGGDGMEFFDDDNRVATSVANDNHDVGMDLHDCCNNTVTKVTANHNATGVVLSCLFGFGNAVRVSAHGNTTKDLSEIGTCTNLLNNVGTGP